jgi:hypothetical protein
MSALDATRSSKRSAAHAAQHVGRQRRLELEDAGGAPGAQHGDRCPRRRAGIASRSMSMPRRALIAFTASVMT